jgi:hypothetical protein
MSKLQIPKAVAGIAARYASIKFDGHFTRVISTLSETVFESSLGTEIYTPAHIWEQCEALPPGEYLGELFVPGKPASCVKTALKHEWPDLQITFFGIDGEQYKYAELEYVKEFFDSHKLNFAPFEVIDSVPHTLSEEELFFYKQRARQAGIEGFIFSTGNLYNLYKLKVSNTIDLVVIGANEGKGKYEGQIGSLKCGLLVPAPDSESYFNKFTNLEIANVGGVDNNMRAELTAMYDSGELCGKVVEVEYQNVDSKGRLRHPRFVRLRDDKLAHECVIGQEPALERFYNGA